MATGTLQDSVADSGTVVYPTVGELVYVDEGDAYGCIQGTDVVTAVNGSVISFGDVDINLDEMGYWCIMASRTEGLYR